ncbi:DEAD/DEAH box helicase [Acinetobacter ursingii]|uniref:DEAD/DEAH box helicase n=1 Tax=Acinetobacter ursingii TaxID=108980 RepID=UPI0021D34955|nr:DEAD/DEAH box helicase family protein [Acinetobacter ursingii]MCU4568838.1 DEAD/DEAH box helicase family protein [Acinetobacter ursingii]
MSYFKDTTVNIVGNNKLRSPQIEAYIKIQDYFEHNPQGEALVVLPTGTGKSGLISIAPYGTSNGRVLIITPGLVTKESISKTQESLKDNFWINFDVIFGSNNLPVICEFTPDITDEHLASSNIIYSNIQRVISQSENCLKNRVPHDFFDMVIIDESHHSAASSWEAILGYFNTAKKLHVTGTPFRGDGLPIPGEKIHETPLSEVMRDKFVKYLKKETVNAHHLYFITPEFPDERLTVEQVLRFKDSEWIQKCVALSKECSMDVINHSLIKLKELREISPDVPHKILAVGCSIHHAEDLQRWYEEAGLKSILIHSNMEKNIQTAKFKSIENHECDVVVSVNMLMEGYDHKYLTILSIFRPYKSLNAFAQVIGRILRAIPEEEIRAFEIDNNATVIFHEEIGLNELWEDFQKEVNRAKNERIKDYTLKELTSDYQRKSQSLAEVDSVAAFISDQDSFLPDIDFNELFESKRQEINSKVKETLRKFTEIQNLDENILKTLEKQLIDQESKKISTDFIDPELLEKRPTVARDQLRKLIKKKTEDEVTNLLSDHGYDPKGLELASSFSRHTSTIKPGIANDGTLVMYINFKLYDKFGSIASRDNATLVKSLKVIPSLIEEVRKMI